MTPIRTKSDLSPPRRRARALGLPAVGTIALLAVPLLAVVPAGATTAAGEPGQAPGSTGVPPGNMIFIHPDGTDSAFWHASRVYYEGPDGVLNWDRLPVSVNYRGHMADELTATSNGGATVHAFGYKVDGPDSFGQDTGAENVLGGDFTGEGAREIFGLSGYAGSWLREAGNAGYPIGVVNDGDASEPGTAVFLSEVGQRGGGAEFDVVRQFLDGRPGFEDVDEDPVVLMSGGEALFLPQGLEYCSDSDAGSYQQPGGVATYPLDCVVHRPAEAYTENVDGTIIDVPAEDLPTAPEPDTLRTDDRNLLTDAAEQGYTVVRTRGELDALVQATQAGDVDLAELKVLGLFADEDVFNDTTEEDLVAEGLVDPLVRRDAKETNLVLYGSPRGAPGFDPPTPAEMSEVALQVLSAHSEARGLPYATVFEVEGTDNFGNNDNAIGSLFEAKRADEMIGVAREYVGRDAETTILTAADSTAGGMQIREFQVAPDAERPTSTGTVPVQPTTSDGEQFEVPVDGRYGSDTEPFSSAPDQFGQRLPFGIAWAGSPDFGGGIVTRAEGQYADVVQSMYARFDNVDVYRVAYLALFGDALPYPQGRVSPTRPSSFDTGDGAQTPGVPGDGPAPPVLKSEPEVGAGTSAEELQETAEEVAADAEKNAEEVRERVAESTPEFVERGPR